MTTNKLNKTENFNTSEGNVKLDDISLTEQWKRGDVHIGTIDNKKIYLMWHDVKDICNDEVKKENAKLKELLRECNLLLIKQQANDEVEHKESAELVLKIEEVLK